MIVTVYTGPGCGRCIATKTDLRKRGIAFREININENPSAIKTLTDMGFNSIPVVLVASSTYEDAWAGYRDDKIAELAEIC